jgi:hypothetical protein
MKPEELREHCTRSLDRAGKDASVVLVVGKRSNPNHLRRVRLAHGGPLGELVCLTADGDVTAMYKAAAILRWLDRIGA